MVIITNYISGGFIMIKKIFLGIPTQHLIKSAIFIIIWGIMNGYLTIALSKTTAANIEKNDFLKAAIFFVGYIILWEIIEYICDFWFQIAYVHMQNGSYRHYFEKLYYTKPEELIKGNSGYAAGILSQLIERKTSMLVGFMMIGISSTYLLYLIYYVGRFSPIFSIIITFLVLLGIAIRLVFSRLTEPALREMTVARGELSRIFIDSIQNISTIQKLRGIEFIKDVSSKYQQDNMLKTKRYEYGNELAFCLFKLVNYMLCPICMFVALYLYHRDSTFPIIEFMAYLAIVTVQLVHMVKEISEFIKNYTQFSATQKEMDSLVAIQSTNYTSTSIGGDFQELSMKDISYQYEINQGTLLTIQIPYFSIKKGERICITGESGQGKTTLLKILSGILEVDHHLYVDGHVTHQNIDAVYIAQDTEMLDMNLRDNLKFGNEDISDDDLIEMLDGIGMLDWFNSLELGLDTLLGERGVFVSTGQRQRLNIIRGLLIDKEIYLLDEPTSNVDDLTEEKMVNLIATKLAGKTVIAVTHKTRIREICNRAYEFQNNQLVEQI